MSSVTDDVSNVLKEPSLAEVLALFHPAVKDWFISSFPHATAPQRQGWPAISKGESTLILAPTGTGKTLTAFLWCIQRLMFEPVPEKTKRCRVLYLSPIKALAVDVERNLRAPLMGIAHAAERQGCFYVMPEISIRTGDTSQKERAQFQRRPSDILITTPESLYLLLTSNAREALRSIDTVIIDEIHALVPTKRGVHLSLSLERLEALCGRHLQRIGLSATQRPLEEVAHYLGGALKRPTAPAMKKKSFVADESLPPDEELRTLSAEIEHEFAEETESVAFRPVTIIATGERKKLDLKIEVPVEDMARLGMIDDLPSGPASQGPKRASIWTAIHPQLLDLIRRHQTTLIFVNSRRIAERLAAALNDLAEETLVRAHHGSLALPQRREVEDRLKLGQLRGLVATSSLELGIDMGTVDLVIQIESPPSVASGMQRIGRASHQVGAVSRGILFPKYRADLVACATITKAMHEGKIESIRYPRNPLDVLAQQLVAMVSMDSWKVDDLFTFIRQSAAYAQLGRTAFESVLDMLSGRYPSDEFAELRPRFTWDRVAGLLTSRQGAKKIAITNAGTIPDRGLYGVFLAGSSNPKGSSRVGELDEEMVHESHVGDTFLLGASTWRIEEITHDKVLVSPAPGQPGKMPFWKADMPGRPLEFGEEIGKFVRELQALPQAVALSKLRSQHGLDQNAAENLLRYLSEQAQATGVVPDDQTVLIERYRDEMGDFRICVLSPLGSCIHIPWCMAVIAKIRNQYQMDVETVWSDDGFVVRFPDMETPPDPDLFLPDPDEVEELVQRQLGSSAMFAARFRENAGRALLLPKRRPGMRAPLWQQRKRAADLLSVASRYGSFPILLETYRECLRDLFDMPALLETLRKLKRRAIQVKVVDSKVPSPYASALLFSYVASFLYDGDAPLAERRAQALSIDQSQLQELLGDTDLRDLLDPRVIEDIEAQLQAMEGLSKAKSTDGLHDLLLRLGDLTLEELTQRCHLPSLMESLRELIYKKRVVSILIQGQSRYIAVEDAARYRDGLGIPLPMGLPDSLLMKASEPLLSLVRRFAHTHGPFAISDLTLRFGIASSLAEGMLKQLHSSGRLIEGEFRRFGMHHEYCDAEVLRLIRQKSLAKLRKQIEPVEQKVLARFLSHWQGILHPARGLDALLDAIQTIQGIPLPISLLEREILPARVSGYQEGQLDTLMAAGEIIWCGVEPLGEHDGRVVLFLTDQYPVLYRKDQKSKLENTSSTLSEQSQAIVQFLQQHGASFFSVLNDALGKGYPGDMLENLWDLVWRGLITNDTFSVLRSLNHQKAKNHRSARPIFPNRFEQKFRSRRATTVPISQGRWSLLPQTHESQAEFSAAWAQQLLLRYGVLPKEAMGNENLPGGFSAVYPALKVMEESGKIRRGWFIAGLSANQFAQPSALDLLRSLRGDSEAVEVVYLAANDPANPYGALLPWPKVGLRGSPETEASFIHNSRLFARAAHTSVILVDGLLCAYLRRQNPEIWIFLPDAMPENEPIRTRISKSLSQKLADLAKRFYESQSGFGTLITLINEKPAQDHSLATFLQEAGFMRSHLGFQMRREILSVKYKHGSENNIRSYGRYQSIELSEPVDSASETAYDPPSKKLRQSPSE